MSNQAFTSGATRAGNRRLWRAGGLALLGAAAAAQAACSVTYSSVKWRFGTKTPTLAASATPPPSSTPTPPYGSLAGFVVRGGTPLAGKLVSLEGSDDCLGFPTPGPSQTTVPSGSYRFDNVHTAGTQPLPGPSGTPTVIYAGYRAVALGGSGGEVAWFASGCTTPVAGGLTMIPALEMTDVTLGAQPPEPPTLVGNSATFEYYGRPGLYFEQYEVYLWDPATGWYWAGPLLPWAAPGTYTLSNAGTIGVQVGVEYRWTLRVHDANGGLGQGAAYKTVRFF